MDEHQQTVLNVGQRKCLLYCIHMPRPADLQGDDLLQTQSAAVQRVGAQVWLGEVDGAVVGRLAPQWQGVQEPGGFWAHQVHCL